MQGGAAGELVLPPAQNYAHALMLHGATADAPLGPGGTAPDPAEDVYWDIIKAGRPLNVMEEMNVAALLNPYTGVAAYDPSGDLDRLDDAVEDFVDSIETFDPETMLADAVNAALENVTDSVLSEAELTAAVTAHRDRTEEAYLRRVSGAAASLLGGRAVMSGGFDAAMTALANQREAEIADFSAKLGMMNREQRTNLSISFAAQYIEIAQTYLNARQAAVAQVFQAVQARVIAEQDRLEKDLDYDRMEVQWKLNQFEYGQGVLSSYAGAGPIPKPSSLAQRLFGNLGATATGAISAGIGLGTATKNPAIGAIGGLTVFGLMTLSNVFK